ncbi:MAG: DUF362 domain-containing protein, partial [Lentisphaeria bacterium]
MNTKLTRRHFLKTGVIAGAGLSFPNLWIQSAHAAYAPGTSIHPNIDDLLVAGITDPAMVNGHKSVTNWAQQESMVNREAVWENMNKMACGLSGKQSATSAWRTIFVIPPEKTAADTIVAIKTNGIARQHTRSAVMSKVCNVVVNDLGIPARNIHIYDACHGGKLEQATPWKGLPEECRVENKWGGSNTETAIPSPWSGKTAKCVEHLVNDSVDILINISMCKGHGNQFGKFTMTMKNHFGTFTPRPGHGKQPLEYLVGINRTPEILGPVNRKTGEITSPRQQLCIVDALWASRGGPGGNPSDQPNFLA